MSTKKTITILCGKKSHKVSWFPGSGDASIEQACRTALELDSTTPLHLVDEEENTIAISDALPDGITLTCVTAPKEHLVVPKGPKPLPFIGNVRDIKSKEGALSARKKLIDTYGSMVALEFPGKRHFICSDAEVLQDMIDRPDDFQKVIPSSRMGLGNLRAHTTGDGLFTCSDSEEIWQIAHRILLPGFGVPAIRQYYERMLEVADELIAHLEKKQAAQPVLITDWMTRMTFEAISYAGFSTRFHSMDNPEMPPFVHAMVTSLQDAMHASERLFPESFYIAAKKKREAADVCLQDTVDKIIQDRKDQIAKGEPSTNDLLQIMLTSTDRVTGKQLPEENIRYQLITFLIAGHETTSGLLSYAIYHLMTNPEVERKLIEEVDTVLGRDFSYRPSYEDLEKLPYTLRILKETLRLNPTAPGFSKTAMKDTVVAGKYALQKGDMVSFLLPSLHRDPRYWTGDPEHFDPDRFLPEEINKRHSSAYHPFGAGVRSCIGFQFALKEATMVLARLYRHFRFHLQDKNYVLDHVETLTIKPKDLYVFIEKRPEEKGKLPKKEPQTKEVQAASPLPENAPALLFLFGSNMGTCQNIAQTLAFHAQAKGYRPLVRELDSQVDKPWESQFVTIITSTYNGTPPDNAARFDKWLKTLQGSPFSSLHFTVLGVGNTQWHSTFQQFPRSVFERMEKLGAKSFYQIGAADVDGDYDQAIETWIKGAWQGLKPLLTPPNAGDVEDQLTAIAYASEIVNFAGAQPPKIPQVLLDQQAQKMQVTSNEELLAKEANRSTRHIEINLPQPCTYCAGDHLGVLPENPQEVVELAAKLCNVRLSDTVVLKSLRDIPQAEKLPIGIPISVNDLLTAYVDLLGPVSRKELRLLAKHCPCPPEKKALEELSQEKFADEVFAKERTFLEICQQYRSIPCSLDLLLTARQALKPRYYSISSSPLALQDRCSITVGVQEHTTTTGRVLEGVCSHFLKRMRKSGFIQCFVKDTKSHFRLPEDPAQDVILIGPGTGLAPLRGFLQERHKQKEQDIHIGRQLLFFGCRHPDLDFLYRKELEEYERSGLLQGLFVAFSRIPDRPKCYVQDLLYRESSLVWEYIQNNARILVCGDGKHMAPAVRAAITHIYESEGKLAPDKAQEQFKQKQDSYLYVEDVWAG